MNILLLEDNCTELQILYNILKKHWPQFHYTCCQNYNDAQKSILSVQYDIFILDIQLSSASDAFNALLIIFPASNVGRSLRTEILIPSFFLE